MSIKEKLEQNIVVVTVGVALATGAVVAPVITYFADQDKKALERSIDAKVSDAKKPLEDEVERLKVQSRSLERRLGDDKFLDIQKFFSTKTSSAKNIKDVRFFEKAGFFGPTPDGVWKYSQETELSLAQSVTGLNLSDAIPKKMRELFEAIPLHVWRGKEEYRLRGSIFAHLFSYIAVQSFGYEKLPQLLGMVKDFMEPEFTEEVEIRETREGTRSISLNSDEKAAKGQLGAEHETFEKVTKTMFKADAAGVFLAFQIHALMGAMAEDNTMTFHLKNVQKIGPIMYCQFIFKWVGVKVDGMQNEKMYMVRELFIFARSDDIIILQTNVPTESPNFHGPKFDEVNVWLSKFFLADE